MTTENQSPAPAHREAVDRAHTRLRSMGYHRDGEFFVNVNRIGAEAVHVSTIANIVDAATPAPAPAVPAGAEPISLEAAVRLGLEYAREALATHDQQFDHHPATALERGSIVADIATMEAALVAPVAGGADPAAWMHPDGRVVPAATMDVARRDGGAMLSSLREYTIPLTAPQAPQQAELTDEQIEAAFTSCGGRWTGDYWRIEDADLHPFVRSMRYPGMTDEVRRLREALEVYADPGFYRACSFLFDRPTGGFDEDFDFDPGYGRPVPGKLARETLLGSDTQVTGGKP